MIGFEGGARIGRSLKEKKQAQATARCAILLTGLSSGEDLAEWLSAGFGTDSIDGVWPPSETRSNLNLVIRAHSFGIAVALGVALAVVLSPQFEP